MADNPLLPGTDIEVVEKYAPGKRLDFPAFASVCKTTFSKGIITDFEKISDDPIEVKSRVKVEVDGQESDYIPLFFHPKAQYWDDEFADPPILATDYDEETGAFKQAWMSFRCGDEVVVMLKEGVPVAVIAFADGVPRIGENIIKVDMTIGDQYSDDGYSIIDRGGDEGIFYFNCFGISDFDYDSPQQLANLLKKRLLDKGSYDKYLLRPFTGYLGPQLPEPTPDDIGLGLKKEWEQIYENIEVVSYSSEVETQVVTYMLIDFVIPAGPILFIFQFCWKRNKHDFFGIPPILLLHDDTTILAGTQVSAILYSRENLDKIKSHAACLKTPQQTYDFIYPYYWKENAFFVYPDSTIQLDFTKDIQYTFCGWHQMDPNLSKIYTRPHTKEELTAAGMWPGAEE